MSEVIRIVERFNAAQQLTAMLTPSMVSMMSNDDRCLFVDKWVILATTAPIQCYRCDDSATLHRTAPTRLLHHEYHTTKTGLIQGNDIPTPKGTDHTPHTMDTDMGNIATDHNHATVPTVTGTAAVPEGTHHGPHPATEVDHASLWPMDATIATPTLTHPRGIVSLHSTLTISPTDVTHTIIPWIAASLALATPTTLHRKHS